MGKAHNRSDPRCNVLESEHSRIGRVFATTALHIGPRNGDEVCEI